MVREILVSFLLCTAILSFTWYIKSLLLRPLRTGDDIHVKISVHAAGSASELENVVKTLVWLSDNGTIPADIEIVNEGLDDRSEQVALALERDNNIFLRRNPDGRQTDGSDIRKN